METTTDNTSNVDWEKLQDYIEMWRKTQQNIPPNQSTCPNCGYCPHCGRGAQPVITYPSYPLTPIYPSYPYPTWIGPVWSGGTSTGDFFPNPTTTTC